MQLNSELKQAFCEVNIEYILLKIIGYVSTHFDTVHINKYKKITTHKDVALYVKSMQTRYGDRIKTIVNV